MPNNQLTAHEQGLMRRCTWAAKEHAIARERGKDIATFGNLHQEAYAAVERELGWGLAQAARAEGFELATAYVARQARNA